MQLITPCLVLEAVQLLTIYLKYTLREHEVLEQVSNMKPRVRQLGLEACSRNRQ